MGIVETSVSVTRRNFLCTVCRTRAKGRVLIVAGEAEAAIPLLGGKLRSSFQCFALTKTNHTLPKLVYLGRPGEC